MVKETRYYDVFEVHPNASLLEIKQSYARLARQYHPDRNCFGTERMQEINMIYNILRDVDQRRLYDLYGDAREANCYHEDEPYVYNYQQEDTDGFDMYQTTHNLNVPLEDIYSGFVRRLRVKRFMKCLICEGRDSSCVECCGKKIFKRVPYVVAFEAGVPPSYSHSIELSGEEYIPSVLTVTVNEMEHKLYRRYGDDLIMKMEIDFKEALTGFDKVLTTIDNRTLHIKKRPGQSTQDKEKMIVKNEGFPLFRDFNNRKGDLIIFARITGSQAIKELPDLTFNLLKRGLASQPAEPKSPATLTLDLAKLSAAEEIGQRHYMPSRSEEEFNFEYRKYYSD